jgi:hypothetical protein
MNKAQTCSFLGWTSAEFDRNVSRGFPARKMNRSRGTDWQVDSKEAVRWVAEQEAAKVRPRRRAEPEVPPDAPPGVKAVLALEHPFEQGFMFGHLDAVYRMPRLVASMAAGVGLPMATVYELTGWITFGLMDLVAREAGEAGLEPWKSAADPDIYELDAFPPINWPNLAHKAGEPGWTPPHYGMGWEPFTPEERAANIRPNTDVAA